MEFRESARAQADRDTQAIIDSVVGDKKETFLDYGLRDFMSDFIREYAYMQTDLLLEEEAKNGSIEAINYRDSKAKWNRLESKFLSYKDEFQGLQDSLDAKEKEISEHRQLILKQENAVSEAMLGSKKERLKQIQREYDEISEPMNNFLESIETDYSDIADATSIFSEYMGVFLDTDEGYSKKLVDAEARRIQEAEEAEGDGGAAELARRKRVESELRKEYGDDYTVYGYEADLAKPFRDFLQEMARDRAGASLSSFVSDDILLSTGLTLTSDELKELYSSRKEALANVGQDEAQTQALQDSLDELKTAAVSLVTTSYRGQFQKDFLDSTGDNFAENTKELVGKAFEKAPAGEVSALDQEGFELELTTLERGKEISSAELKELYDARKAAWDEEKKKPEVERDIGVQRRYKEIRDVLRGLVRNNYKETKLESAEKKILAGQVAVNFRWEGRSIGHAALLGKYNNANNAKNAAKNALERAETKYKEIMEDMESEGSMSDGQKKIANDYENKKIRYNAREAEFDKVESAIGFQVVGKTLEYSKFAESYQKAKAAYDAAKTAYDQDNNNEQAKQTYEEASTNFNNLKSALSSFLEDNLYAGMNDNYGAENRNNLAGNLDGDEVLANSDSFWNNQIDIQTKDATSGIYGKGTVKLSHDLNLAESEAITLYNSRNEALGNSAENSDKQAIEAKNRYDELITLLGRSLVSTGINSNSVLKKLLTDKTVAKAEQEILAGSFALDMELGGETYSGEALQKVFNDATPEILERLRTALKYRLSESEFDRRKRDWLSEEIFEGLELASVAGVGDSTLSLADAESELESGTFSREIMLSDGTNISGLEFSEQYKAAKAALEQEPNNITTKGRYNSLREALEASLKQSERNLHLDDYWRERVFEQKVEDQVLSARFKRDDVISH